MQLRASLDVQGSYVQPGTSSHAILKSIESQRVRITRGERKRNETKGEKGRKRNEEREGERRPS